MSQALDIGVDLGTTMTKAAAYDVAGAVVAEASDADDLDHPSPRLDRAGAGSAFDAVDELMAALVARAGAARPFRRSGFTGMAETGSVVRDGGALAPLIAWFDPRGEAELDRTPEPFRSAFPARSGPAGDLARIDRQDALAAGARPRPRGRAVAVGPRADLLAPGRRAGRRALDGRADRASRRPCLGRSAPALSVLGVGADFVPPLRPAGAFLGRVRADHPVAAFAVRC